MTRGQRPVRYSPPMSMLSRARVVRPAVAAAAVAAALTLGCSSLTPTPSERSSEGPSASPIAGAPECIPIPGPLPVRPWWADTTFYELFVRSFADGDGDGIGDFRGLTAHLDYLNDGHD